MMRIGGINAQNEKEAGEVRGNGKFDKNGKLNTPKVKKTAEQLASEIDNPKMDREIAKMDTKPKKKEPWMDRNHFEDGLAFVERCKTELGMTVKMMPVNNKHITQEPLLVHKSGRKVAWVCPRANQRFGLYAFFIDRREIHKIVTLEDIEKEFDIIKEICKAINELPSQKERTTHKRSNGSKSKHATPKTPDEHMKKIRERMDNISKKSVGIAVPSGILPNDDWFKEFCESEGLKVDWENRVLSRA